MSDIGSNGNEKQPSGERDSIRPGAEVGTGFGGVPAVVLAGGKNKPALAELTGVSNKALVRLGGRAMLSRVLDALTGARLVSTLAVVGGAELDEITRGLCRVDSGDSIVDNIKAGIVAAGGKGKVLLVCSDIPLITPPMVDDFVERSLAADADLCYPIIPRADAEARFPGMRRTYANLKDGAFTGGNMMLIDAAFLLRNETIVRDVYNARKKPFQLAGLLGFGLVVRYVTGQATVRHAEESASRALKGTLQAIITHHAEIGADVDKPDDVVYTERLLGEV